MLAFAVRGVVLLSVLSWYSVTVWKMIDGYFKDQFRDYLQNEYRKYPGMKADIKNIKIVDKGSVPDASPAESSPEYNRIAETYDPETTCPVDTVDACQQTIGASNGKAEESVAGENAADTVNVSSADKNAFPESAFPGQSELQSRKSSSGSDADNEEGQPSAVDQNGGRENEAIKKSAASSSRRLNRKRLPKEISKERSREKPKKRRVNTIVLTDADFASVKIRKDADDDFSEFEEEEGQKVRAEEGILVSELPFKPKADIGDLDRVTAEEFCPLTLEDEASCGETTTWQ